MSSEVRWQAERRTFSAADKARILAEYEAAGTPLERAGVMRRSGVYSSLFSNWRKQLETSQPAKKRGRLAEPQAAESFSSGKRMNAFVRQLAKSEKVVAAMGKA